MNKRNKRLKPLFIPLLAFMLIVSTILPVGVFAADSTSEIQINMTVKRLGGSEIEATEAEMKTNGLELILTPEGKQWATDLDQKKNLVITALGEFAKDLNLTTADVDITNNELTIKVNSTKTVNYTLDDDRTYTFDFSPVLIENWPGKVNPVNLKVYAHPQLTLGGSIKTSTTPEDIQNGGKTIELKLVNATWNQTNLKNIEHYNKLLRSFTLNSTPWDVASSLINTDPNKVISFSDERTLLLNLPPVSNALTGTVSFTISNTDSSDLYTVDTVNQGTIGGDTIQGNSKTFTIDPNSKPKLELALSGNEKEIKGNDTTRPQLKLTLTNAKWSDFSNQKKQLLIDSLIAKDQKDQWELIKEKLPSNNVKRVSETEATIDIPQVEEILLKKDQTITAKVPYQLLEKDVNLPDQSFTIIAQPKALLSGTALTNMTQTDLIKGGKTIILSLVNTKWQNDVATNTIKRNDLLKSFNWSPFEEQILARADVKRTNDSTVNIKLPPVDIKFAGSIVFDSQKLATTSGLLDNTSNFLSYTDTFKVSEVNNQAATISGTIKDNTNNLDIVKGGKTVTITLKNDTWDSSVKTQKELQIDNNPIKLSIDGTTINYSSIERKNDTTVTLTLSKNNLSLSKDSSLAVEVPSSLLNISNSKITDSSTRISAITASLTGTGLSMDAVDVQKGGKTLIFTLNNAEFTDKADADFKSLFKDKKDNEPWKSISDIKVSKNKLTVKLPAVKDYKPTTTNSIKLSLSSDLIKGYENDSPSKNILIDKENITIGATASATISSSALTEAAIRQGNNTITITLKDADWDSTIESNASKKAALMKGFKVVDQTKEWGLVTTAIAKNGDFKVNGKILTIKLPPIPEYAIVRDQVVSITLPKTLLSGYKYDIPTGQLKITIPPLDNEMSFAEMLDSSLADFIEQNGINNIRVAVPVKHIEKFTTYISELGKAKVATINVYTTDEAVSVTASLESNEGEISRTVNNNVNNMYTFVFDDMKDDSTLHITVRKSDGEVIQEVYQKVTKGNKTYTIAPKTPLDGKYSLYSLLTEKSLLTNILKYYTLDELKIGTTTK